LENYQELIIKKTIAKTHRLFIYLERVGRILCICRLVYKLTSILIK